MNGEHHVERRSAGRVHAVAWVIAILSVLVAAKFVAAPGNPPYGVDASYYFQIANHVARGHGFVTTVSLYHEGLVLPSPAQIYPLWPLVLGYTGRWIGIVRAANVLPPVFYAVSLILLDLLTRAVGSQVGRLRFSDRWYVPDGAHLVVALFGLNISYFGATSHPYTEGLSFTLAFASFLALHRCTSSRAMVWAFVAGCAAGLAYLGRSQMIAVAIGTIPVLALAAWRARSVRGLVSYLLGAGTAVIPWILYLGRVPGAPFLGEWKSVPKVAIPSYFEPGEFGSVYSHFEGAAFALLHAFNFASDMSFTRTFGPAALLPPIAAVILLFALRRNEPSKAATDGRTVPAALVIAGLFVFVVLMFFPAAFGLRYLFGWRHGLTHVFLIIPTVPYLLGRARGWSWGTAAVLAISVALGARTVFASVAHGPPLTLRPPERSLVAFLAQHRRPPRVLTTNAQILGAMSDAHFHWTDCNSPGESTRLLVERLKVDYLVAYEGDKRCAFVEGVFDYMRGVEVFQDERSRVYVLAPR